MAWQDWVLALSNVILGLSLIPTIRSHDKPALSTGIITTVLVGVVAATMLTMELWLTAAITFVNSGAWGVITVQKVQQIRARHHPIVQEIEEEIVHGISDD